MLSFLLVSNSFAHGGRTNSSGCHNQKSTGGYHCHNTPKPKPPSPKQNLNKSKDFDCNKKYCKDMQSCDEAEYQFKICGHSSLDGDSDGVPCENVCPGG